MNTETDSRYCLSCTIYSNCYDDYDYVSNIDRTIAKRMKIITYQQVFISQYYFVSVCIKCCLLYTGKQTQNSTNSRNKRWRNNILRNRRRRANRRYYRKPDNARTGFRHQYHVPPNVRYIPTSHNYPRKDVHEMYKTLSALVRKTANPHTLPQVVRVVAETKLMDNRMKYHLIMYMMKMVYSLSIQGVLPPMAEPKPSSNGSSIPSIVHHELDVLGYPSCPYDENPDGDTTQRTNSLAQYSPAIMRALVSID